MLVKVMGFDPVAVFFTVTVELAVVFTTMLVKLKLEGVIVIVGGVVAPARGPAISTPVSSPIMHKENLTEADFTEN